MFQILSSVYDINFFVTTLFINEKLCFIQKIFIFNFVSYKSFENQNILIDNRKQQVTLFHKKSLLLDHSQWIKHLKTFAFLLF